MECTYSEQTYVEMSREISQLVEKNSRERLVEDWGDVFKWMDLCAAVSAMKHSKTGKLVTAQVDDMRILRPFHYGDMLTVCGQGEETNIKTFLPTKKIEFFPF